MRREAVAAPQVAAPKINWKDLTPAAKYRLRWKLQARPEQLTPPGDWNFWLVLAGRGWGKGFELSTPIPTPQGWKTIGDVQNGDEVFDEWGVVCSVVKAHAPYLPQRAYRFTFSDGEILDSCDEHQWVTWTHAERKAFLRSQYEWDTSRFPSNWPVWRVRKQVGMGTYLKPQIVEEALALHAQGESARSIERILGVCRQSIAKHLHLGGYLEPVGARIQDDSLGPKIRVTQEIVDTLTYGKRGDLNHCIPQCGPLDLESVDLPIPPYTLGVWLGDGSTSDGTIAQHEDDQKYLITEIRGDGFECTRRSDPQTFGVLGLSPLTKKYGLMRNKHVPPLYLRSSVAQRLALLQGLMDTDGGVEGASSVSFSNCNKNIADSVYELVVSLGMRATRELRLVSQDKTGRMRMDCHRVTFTPTMQVFRLPRKAKRISFDCGQQLRRCHRMITDAEPIDPIWMRCLTVDSPNSMYLAGTGMIPTHNTRVGAEDIALYGMENPGSRIAVVAPSYASGRDVCIEGNSGLLSCLPDSEVGDGWNRSLGELNLRNGTIYSLFTAEKPDALRGPQFHRAWCLIAGTQITMSDGSLLPIEEVSVGDMVATPNGPRRVSDVGSRMSELVSISCLDGSTLCGSPEHPVWNGSWTPLSTLRIGDRLRSWLDDGARTFTGTSTATRAGRSYSSTESYGRSITDLSLREWISTISTKTGQITGFLISGFSLLRNIGHSILNQLPVAPAYCAGGFMSTLAYNAPCTASPANGKLGNLSASYSQEGVSTAVKSSRPGMGTSVVSAVSTLGVVGRVYNLTVEDEHCYYANGLLTHNCDEICQFGTGLSDTGEKVKTGRRSDLQYCWDMLQMCMRLKHEGRHPQTVITTTPLPLELIKDLIANPKTHVTTGSTYDNKENLAESYIDNILHQYEGTRLGEQEIYAKILDDIPGALWQREWIDRNRILDETSEQVAARCTRIVVAIDPATTSTRKSDMTGIVVVGIDESGHGYVLADETCKVSPKEWAQSAIRLYRHFKADRIIAETNNGGDMVIHTIKSVDENVPTKKVTASKGKVARAEPIAALYEQNRVSHVGKYERLENEQCMFTVENVLKVSPNRADSLVWGLSELYDNMLTYGALEYLKSEQAADIAKIQASSTTKPMVADQTAKCPECSATCVVRIAGHIRCNQCGCSWGQTPLDLDYKFMTKDNPRRPRG